MAATDGFCLPARCAKTKKDFYLLYYLSYDKKWVLTYGKTELPEGRNSGKSTSVSVDLKPTRTGPQYKCPHCGEKYFFVCWNCGKRTCYDGDNHEGRSVTCAFCDKSGVFSSKFEKKSDSKKEKEEKKEITGININGQN